MPPVLNHLFPFPPLPRLFKTLIIIIISFLSGYYFHQSSSDSAPVSLRRSQNYHFINPLIDYDFIPSDSTSRHLLTLKSDTEQLISKAKKSGQIQNAAIYYRELNDGPWFGINETDLFSPSSLIKVPLLIAIYKTAAKNPQILDQTLVYQSAPDSSQNIPPQHLLQTGQKYSVSDLLHQLIVFSDNSVYNLLLPLISPELLSLVYQDLCVQLHTQNNATNNIISVKDYASFFRVLYNASYLTPDYSEKALFLLSQTDYRQGLVAKLPSDLSVAHKFGERYFEDANLRQLHDCGIVYFPQKPYLLCIMTQGRQFDGLASFIASASRQIYDLQSSK